MKKYTYLLAIAALFALAVITSCKKEPPLRVETNTQSPDPALLQEAKDWYRQQLVLPSSVAEGAIDLKAYTPDWNKAKVVKNSKGQDVVGVPLFSSKDVYMELNVLVADGKSFGIVKKYVLNNEKKIELSIYKAPGDLIVKGYYDKERRLFMAGSPKGKLMGDKPEQSSNEGQDGGGGSGGGVDINGGTLGEVVIVGQPIHHNNPTNFPPNPIGNPNFGAFDPIYNNGYGSGNSSVGGSGTGSGGNNTPKPDKPNKLSDIKDSLTNDCLKSTLGKMQSTNLNYALNDIICNTFSVNDRVNVTFKESSVLSNRLGEERISLDATVNGVRYFDAVITLNSNILPNASQEYIASTMMHEVLHAYFDYNNNLYDNSLGQHLLMAINYVDDMRMSLQKIFPSLSDTNANALIINGFSEIQSKQPANFNEILSHYKLTLSQVGIIRDSYSNGSTGTKCP